MIRIVLFGVVLIVVLIVVGAVVDAAVTMGKESVVREADEPPRRKMPRGVLGVLGIVAVVSSIGLATTVGDGWPLLPLLLWLVIFVGAWYWTTSEPTRWPDEPREEFGEEGTELIERADAAVGRILSSEAASLGWLGDPAELDFKPDLMMIADNLKKAQALRKVMAELSALPTPTADDNRLLEEARSAVRKLEEAVRTRVKTLEECADESAKVDRSLCDEEEQARITERRDDVRSRLSAMLYGVEVSGESQPSESADAVKARVDAFRELKGMIDEQRLEDGRNTSKWLRGKRFQ